MSVPDSTGSQSYVVPRSVVLQAWGGALFCACVASAGFYASVVYFADDGLRRLRMSLASTCFFAFALYALRIALRPGAYALELRDEGVSQRGALLPWHRITAIRVHQGLQRLVLIGNGQRVTVEYELERAEHAIRAILAHRAAWQLAVPRSSWLTSPTARVVALAGAWVLRMSYDLASLVTYALSATGFALIARKGARAREVRLDFRESDAEPMLLGVSAGALIATYSELARRCPHAALA